MRRPPRGAPALPPGVPPEYAEAYLRGYEQARAATAGTSDVEPDPPTTELPAVAVDAETPASRSVPGPRTSRDDERRAAPEATVEQPAPDPDAATVALDGTATVDQQEGFRPWAFEPPDDGDEHAPRAWQFEPPEQPTTSFALDLLDQEQEEPSPGGWAFEPPREPVPDDTVPAEQQQGSQEQDEWPDLVPGLRTWARVDGAELEEPGGLGRVPDWLIPVLTVAVIVALFAVVIALAR